MAGIIKLIFLMNLAAGFLISPDGVDALTCSYGGQGALPGKTIENCPAPRYCFTSIEKFFKEELATRMGCDKNFADKNPTLEDGCGWREDGKRAKFCICNNRDFCNNITLTLHPTVGGPSTFGRPSVSGGSGGSGGNCPPCGSSGSGGPSASGPRLQSSSAFSLYVVPISLAISYFGQT